MIAILVSRGFAHHTPLQFFINLTIPSRYSRSIKIAERSDEQRSAQQPFCCGLITCLSRVYTREYWTPLSISLLKQFSKRAITWSYDAITF
jgi:hypothetical protein